MGKIWLTSDLHFCHNRDFLYGPRGFGKVEDMNTAIVKNWNEQVSPDDDVYVLGDLMLNDNEQGLKLLKSLKGNIHVILGNHDTDARVDLYQNTYNVVEVEYGLPFKYDGYRFFLSHYPTLCTNGDSDKPLNKRVINLCGHSHTKDKFMDFDKGLIYHVELDAHDMKLVDIDTVINDIKQKLKL